jgi:tRNA modification GTPase
MMNETIYALASARGRAGIGVVRLSGPRSFELAELLTGLPVSPRRTSLRVLCDSSGQELDQALVLAFEEGASFTGEQVVEFHVHGSLAVISALTKELGLYKDVRLAEPGEFTRRALENECLDLSQTEGLADLIDAETESQHRQALQAMRGALGEKVEVWRLDLIRAVSLIEVTIDFVDDDVPVDVSEEVIRLIDTTLDSLRQEIAGSFAAERIREGFEVAIMGPPNIGKSTLLNALAGRKAAITSEIAGTTRDIIEVRMEIGGLAVTLLDTAGIRESKDLVENLGMDAARSRAEQADLRIFMTENGAVSVSGVKVAPQDLIVIAKCDLGAEGKGLKVSGKSGEGLDRLLADLAQILSQRTAGAGLAIRERHRVAMREAVSFLSSARQKILEGESSVEVAAMELHTGIQSLNSLMGYVGIEHVLDEIFSRFCLGK